MQTLTCPKCTAPLSAATGMRTVRCEFCGTVVSLDEVRSGEENGLESKASLLQKAESCCVHQEFVKAEAYYTRFINLYPSDWRGNWGLILANTENLSGRKGKAEYLRQNMEIIRMLAPEQYERLNPVTEACIESVKWAKFLVDCNRAMDGYEREAAEAKKKLKNRAVIWGVVIAVLLLDGITEKNPDTAQGAFLIAALCSLFIINPFFRCRSTKKRIEQAGSGMEERTARLNKALGDLRIAKAKAGVE